MSENSDVIVEYIRRHRTRIAAFKEWTVLAARCKRLGDQRLLTAVTGLGESDIKDEEECGKAFLSFLRTDDSVSEFFIKMHEKSLAAFDAVSTPFAREVKESLSAMLMADFALWQGHRQVLTASFQNPDVFDELDANIEFREMLEESGVFHLWQSLCFSDLWKEIFQQTAEVD